MSGWKGRWMGGERERERERERDYCLRGEGVRIMKWRGGGRGGKLKGRG